MQTIHQTPPARIGVNTEIILGLVLSGLLGWVGITTYSSALGMRELSTKLDIFMSTQDGDLRELHMLISELEDQLRGDILTVRRQAAHDTDRLEGHLNTIWPRMRSIEAELGITKPPKGEYELEVPSNGLSP